MGIEERDDSTLASTGADPGDETLFPLLEHLARSPDVSAPPRSGDRIAGRFEIHAELGRGGFGCVYLARDLELGREVAVKVIGLERATRLSTPGLQLFEREAQATARLNHPNIVTVHDFGSWNGFPYLILERLRGETLQARLGRGPLSVPEALRVILPVLRALAHAHAAGIIHRDIKPNNVFLLGEGGVKVLDFGLAKMLLAREEAPPPEGESAPPGASTLRGAGTPAYMAPEQWRGEPQDERTDLFGVGVLLFEMLSGRPPFQATDVRSTLFEPGPPPSLRERVPAVPQALSDIVSRALATDPAARPQSATELEAALRAFEQRLEGRRASRRNRWLVAAAVLGVGASLAIPYAIRKDPRLLCRGAEGKFAGIWDGEIAGAVRTAFLATATPYADAASAGVARTVDAYHDAWVAMHQDACEATRVRGEQSEELLDLRMSCLSRRLGELRALSEVFRQADARVVQRAVSAVYALTPVSLCADAEALKSRAEVPKDPALRAKIDAVQAALDRTKAHIDTGKWKEGLAIARESLSQARAIGSRPLEADALHFVAGLEEYTGDGKGAERSFREAARIAEAAKQDLTAAHARVGLVYVVGVSLGRAEDAIEAGRDAQAAVDRAGGDPDVQARLFMLLGVVERQRGRTREARDLQERALAIWSRVRGPNHPSVARLLGNIGNAFKDEGRYREALEAIRRALTIFEKTLGPHHPDVAGSLDHIGRLQQAVGEPVAALPNHERALAIFERAMGRDHPFVAMALEGKGATLARLGRREEAAAELRKSIALFEKKVGPGHRWVASVENFLGAVLCDLGRGAEALTHHRRALAIAEKALGAEHPGVADALHGIGRAQHRLGRHREALESLGRALALRERALGAEHPEVAESLCAMAEVYLALGKPARARAPLERAVNVLAARSVDPATLAGARFALARALAGMHREEPRVAVLAAAARDGFSDTGERSRREAAAVRDWLAARRSKGSPR
jgi:tetratricopeptide (TPR) repeat protein